MNPFGLFQGFGQMSRSDFKPPAPAPSRGTNPYNSGRGNGNTNPYGGGRGNGNTDPYGAGPRVSSPPRGAGNSRVVPTGPSVFKPMQAADFGGGPLGAMRAADFRGGRTLAAAPAYERPAAVAVSGGKIEADYRVPPGQPRMPSVAPSLPAGSTASRANAVMAPIGASRNSDLVQAAGNAGMRLADPAAFAMFAGNGVMPATSEDTSRRMLSEFGSGRPALAPTAAFDTSSELASAAISPRTLATAASAFTPAAAGGDRFSSLRPDIAAWARANQGAAKSVNDGMNIVDRFMAKQGAAMPLPGPSTIGFADGRQVTGPLPEAPLTEEMSLSGPSTIGFADGRRVTGSLPASSVRTVADLDRSPGMQNQTVDLFGTLTDPNLTNPGLTQRLGEAFRSGATGALPTRGANIGLSAEQQSQIGQDLSQPPSPAAGAILEPDTDMVSQVQRMRMIRNNSRPAPGTAGVRP